MSITIHKSLRPEAVCSKPGSRMNERYGIEEPWYDQESKAVMATNGRTCVLLPVETDNGEPDGVLPAAALKLFRKKARGIGDLEIMTEGAELKCLGITVPRPSHPGKRPDVKAVIPPREEPMVTRKGSRASQEPTVIGIDVKLLAALGKALGTDTVRLQIKAEDCVIRVDPIHLDGGPSGYGAIMPISGA